MKLVNGLLEVLQNQHSLRYSFCHNFNRLLKVGNDTKSQCGLYLIIDTG